MVYVGGTDLNGQPIDVRDPLGPRLRALSEGPPESRVAALLAVREVFPEPLARAIKPGVTAAFATLTATGARSAVESLT